MRKSTSSGKGKRKQKVLSSSPDSPPPPPPQQKGQQPPAVHREEEEEEGSMQIAEDTYDFAHLTHHQANSSLSPPMPQHLQPKHRSSSLGFATSSSYSTSTPRAHRPSFPFFPNNMQERRDSLLNGHFPTPPILHPEQDTGSEPDGDDADDEHLPAPIFFSAQIHTSKLSSSALGSRRPKPPQPITEKARTSILSSIRAKRFVQKRVNQDAAATSAALTPAAVAAALMNLPKSNESCDNSSQDDEEQHDSASTVIPMLRLDRGGVLVRTSLGLVQFGIPPETIKDSLKLGLEVPQHYVVPRDRFDIQVGLNMCELEFPGYYQFFLNKRSMTVIVPNEETEKQLKHLMDEILRGPPPQHLYTEEECLVDPTARPDHVKEMEFFVRPRDGRTIEVDSLFTFQRFEPVAITEHSAASEDEVLAQVDLSPHVRLLETSKEWIVMDHGKELCRVEFWLASMVPTHTAEVVPNALPERNFIPPKLGITVLGSSHGFDSKQNTSGFVLWMHGKGIMVDPPPFCTGDILKRAGISPRWISAIILTHCHADHDAGTFQKILVEGRVTLITTKTIMASFLRKYSRISGFTEAFLCRLFEPRIVRIGEDVFYAGGRIKFHYSLHALPCIGFQAFVNGKSVAYSGDTLYEPTMLDDLCKQGVLSEGRKQSLLNFPFETADMVLHEAGIPPIHTPVNVLKSLSENARERLYLIHIAEQAAEQSGLRYARAGVEHTIRVVDDDRNSLSFVLDVLTHSELFFPHLASANRYGRALVLAAQDTTAQYESPLATDFAFLDHAKNAHGARHNRPLPPAAQQQQPQRLSNLSQGSRPMIRSSSNNSSSRARFSTAGAMAMFADEVDDDFTVPQVADLLRMSATTVKQANAVVSARQGEGDTGLYLILKGFCQIQRKDGLPTVPCELVQPCEGPVGAVLEPGDCFGILSVGEDSCNALLRTSEVVSLTEVELIEVDLQALGYMLNTYPALDARLSRMHELRMLSAWKTMELNSCLQRLVSFQRTQLLSILQKKEFRAGEELWPKRAGPRPAYLVITGELVFPEMAEMDHPFTAGAFLCDFHSMIERRQMVSSQGGGGANAAVMAALYGETAGAVVDEEKSSVHSDTSQQSIDVNSSTLSASSSSQMMSSNPSLVARTNCEVFQIPWKDAFQFLESNPGVLVQIFLTCAAE